MSTFLSMPLTLRSLRQQTQTPLLDGSNQAPTRCSAPASTSQCFENTACQVVCRGDWLSMFDIGFHDEHRAQNRDRPFARWNEPLGTSSGEPNHPSNKRPVGWRCLLQAIRDIQWQPVAALVERPSWRGGTNRSRHSYRRSCKAAS